MQTPNFLVKRGITQVVSLDIETYYSVDYTLRKMSMSLYIFDPQFLIHGIGININGVTNYYNTDKTIRKALSDINWSVTAVLGFNTQFDMLALFYHYGGIVPAYYLDALSMARPYLQNILKSLSLDSVSKYFKIGGKLGGLQDTKGKRELTLKESVRLGIYCKNDVDITIKVFEKLLPYFKDCMEELDVIHLTIKMYAAPQLIVDENLIDKDIHNIKIQKQDLFDKAKLLFPKEYRNIELLKVLRSGDMFKNVIEHNGLVPPRKISKTTGLETHAFARTDLDFQKMDTGIDIPNQLKETAKLLFNARVTSKSDTALNKAIILKKFAKAKCCPVYLRYYGANTSRWSGGDKINMQNLPRGGLARKSLLAKPNHYLLVSDLAQIELRVSAWFCDQMDIIKIFAEGKDVYKDMATKIYGIKYEDVTKAQRTVAKVTVLGLGYGAGQKTFDLMLRAGAMGPKLELSRSEIHRIHTTYRQSNDRIVAMWRTFNTFLECMLRDTSKPPITHKGVRFEKERAVMPNGTIINYNNLRADDNNDLMYNGANGRTKRIYCSLCFENVIQSLARHVIAEQMIKVSSKYDVVLSVHDELVIMVPKNEIEEATIFVENIMRTSPSWCSDLPINCESGYSIEYSK